MAFKLNNDIKKAKFTWHNQFHFWVAMLLSISFGLLGGPRVGFVVSYGIWLAWEIGDGFKPWYTEFEYNEFQPFTVNWLRENLFYSDGFSLQDAFIWNLSGALIGVGIVALIVG